MTPPLDRCWSAVVKVVQKLYKDSEATHKDVCAALGIPAKGNAFHLSLIRSGSEPGSFTVTRPGA
jgi:hypothetical protein